MRRTFSLLMFALALGAVAPRASLALPPPDLALTAGTTFAATGEPNSGGLSLSAAPMWPIAERVRFGVALFADDLGTRLSELTDPNNGLHLGTVPTAHRWTYGAAWRAEASVLERRNWAADAVGQWGYWRLENDLRGTVTGAGSAVGFSLGANLRRNVTGPQSMGLAVRYHRLFSDHGAAHRRVDRYATLALEWRWAGTRP